MDSSEVGQLIQNQRQKLKLSQKELGKMLNVTFQAVSNWENGKAYPDIELLPELCKILKIDITALLGMPQAQRIYVQKPLQAAQQEPQPIKLLILKEQTTPYIIACVFTVIYWAYMFLFAASSASQGAELSESIMLYLEFNMPVIVPILETAIFIALIICKKSPNKIFGLIDKIAIITFALSQAIFLFIRLEGKAGSIIRIIVWALTIACYLVLLISKNDKPVKPAAKIVLYIAALAALAMHVTFVITLARQIDAWPELSFQHFFLKLYFLLILLFKANNIKREKYYISAEEYKDML